MLPNIYSTFSTLWFHLYRMVVMVIMPLMQSVYTLHFCNEIFGIIAAYCKYTLMLQLEWLVY